MKPDTASENLVAGTTPQSYAGYMDLVRRMLFGLIIALCGAVASASVAMVESDISRNTNCPNELHAAAPDMGAGSGHDHPQHKPGHADTDHDHDSCTQHSCPALSAESSVAGDVTDLVLDALHTSESRLRVLSVQHDLNRPPRA